MLRAADPRRAFALIAARFYPRQPEKLVAVTGTSGKTSVVDFTRQIFAAAGKPAASIGTLGVITATKREYGSLTTPDPAALHATLDRLAREGVTHAALEASSHGLDQRRLDGLRLTAAAFTNLGRDHMDYHPTVADYLAAKLRLFRDILPADGTAVIAMDGARAEDVLAAVSARGQRVFRTGIAGEETAAGGRQDGWVFATASRDRLRPAVRRAAAARRGIPGVQRAGRGGSRDRGRDRCRRGDGRARAAQRRDRAAGAGGQEGERRDGVRRLRPQARRDRQRARRAPPDDARAAGRRHRRRRRPRPRQASADGQGRGRERRRGDRHRRQSAQRGAGGDPPRGACRGAGRDRDRRPRRGDRGGDRHARSRRRAVHRRQGP